MKIRQNENKTEVMDIGLYQTNICEVHLSKATIEPVPKAKNLGFYFDHLMTLEDQIMNTQKICNINLCNLKRIGTKLPQSLKIQLVHSCVFSVLDYCNSTYGALSGAALYKLQKIQNDAVRFIFKYQGQAKMGADNAILTETSFSACFI